MLTTTLHILNVKKMCNTSLDDNDDDIDTHKLLVQY